MNGVSCVLAWFVPLAIWLCTGYVANTVFATIVLVIGHIMVHLYSVSEQKHLLNTFRISYIVYSTFAILYYFAAFSDWSFFLLGDSGGDSHFFYQQSKEGELVNLKNIFISFFSSATFGHYEIFLLYIRSLASLATHFFDGNNLFLQSYGSVFFGLMSVFPLYSLIKTYLRDTKLSCRYTLYFILCSAFLTSSVVVMRDIHIAFFFLCGFLIVSRRFKWTGEILLVLINFIIWSNRYQHGFFFLLFHLFYFYKYLQKYRAIFIFLAFIVLIITFSFLSSSFESVIDSINRYEERGADLSEVDSLRMFFMKYPSPIKEIMMIVKELMDPFPSYSRLWKMSNNDWHWIIVYSHDVLSQFCSFGVIYALVRWTMHGDIKNVNNQLLLLSLMGFILIAANYQQGLVRRIMCVYPILYVLFLVLRHYHVSLQFRRRVWREYLYLYGGLNIVYLFIRVL